MQKQSQPQTTNNPKDRDASAQIREGRHTPGPWDIDGRTIVSGLEEEARYWEKAIADMIPDYKVPLQERQANARLIAAAPELLAELEAAEQIILAMLNVMTQEQKSAADEKLTLAGVSTGGMTRYHERRAAIKKARGQ